VVFVGRVVILAVRMIKVLVSNCVITAYELVIANCDIKFDGKKRAYVELSLLGRTLLAEA
jgi:hypothetical protein